MTRATRKKRPLFRTTSFTARYVARKKRLSGNRRGWVANVGQDGSLSHGDHQIWGCTTPIPNEPKDIFKFHQNTQVFWKLKKIKRT
jgi:hypothetical protein